MYPVNKARIQPSGGGGGGGAGALRRVGGLREGKCEAEPLLPLLSCFYFFSSCLLKKALEADTAHCVVCIVTNNCTANISSIG